MLKFQRLQLHLRYIWIRIHALVSRETRTCCNCGAPHRRRNADGSFQAFCKEACFAEAMDPRCTSCMEVPTDRGCGCTQAGTPTSWE